MLNIVGYSNLKEIYKGSKSIVYLAIVDGVEVDSKFQDGKAKENVSVILKIPANGSSQENIAVLRHEYDLIRNLNAEGIVSVLDFKRVGITHCLIREDFGGISLLEHMRTHGKFSVNEFLKVAEPLVKALDAVHQADIIHRDIKPANIILNVKTGEVKITDFGSASRLSVERNAQPIGQITGEKGTLVYTSPEQTGRMNRSVDYRSDYYSLGVTFYEMLVGHPPFSSRDPLELIHAHIAREPDLPHKIEPGIPRGLSRIILKLLAKTTEDRYQSIIGLLTDLDKFEEQNFVPGQTDVKVHLQIPEKLYGRKEDIRSILSIFEKVEVGERHMLLLSGHSGIGKTALVHEVQRPLSRTGGFFISGKFDQLQRNIPFAPVIRAFRDLIHRYLTESQEKLAEKGAELREALSTSGQIIVDAIPEVVGLIGQQKPVYPLTGEAARERFMRTFRNFAAVFTHADRPLVLFLDDLQWADNPSLQLLQELQGEEMRYLFIIGAYRDNEVGPSHPVHTLIKKVEQEGVKVNRIKLESLKHVDIISMLADTLQLDTTDNRLSGIAQLMEEKTGGNPFFLSQFLETLEEKKLLEYVAREWIWNVDRIRSAGITENVVELMSSKIRKLESATGELMRIGACLGNTFHLHTLARVSGQETPKIARSLWPALKEGLILPGDDNYRFSEYDDGLVDTDTLYRFVHDRVQEASYELISHGERSALHLKIGRMMLSNEQGNAVSSQQLFEIVSHCNEGRALISDLQEIERLSRLNLAAARRARESVAFEATITYASVGEELLQVVFRQDPGNPFCNELLEYKLLIGECLYLQSQFSEADEVFNQALLTTSSAIQRARIFVIRIYLYTNRSEYSRAVQLAIDGLAEFGIDLQPPKIATEMIKLYKSANAKRNKRSMEEILALPELNDPEKRAAMDLLVASTGATYVANAELSQLVPLYMVNITLEYGNTASASHGYALFGMFLSAMQNFEAAYEFGKLGIALAEKYDRPDLSSKVNYLFSLAVSHWRRPAFEGIEHLDKAYRYALDSGDRIYAGFSRLTSSALRSIVDHSVEELLNDCETYLAFLRRMQHSDGELWIIAIRQRLLALQGKTVGLTDLSDSEVNEAKLDLELAKSEMKSARVTYLVQKIMLLCWFHQYEEAMQFCKVGREIAVFVATQIMEAEFNFYDSLATTGAILAAPDSVTVGGDDRITAISRLTKNQKMMRRWSENCPANFLHKLTLVDAELAVIEGAIERAGILYDESARLANQNGFWQDAALANEKAALHFSKRGIKKAAIAYFRDAYEGYKQYGAKTKVDHIAELFSIAFPGQNIDDNIRRPFSPFDSSSMSSSHWDEELDIRTVLKATTAISGEIVLEQLQEKLLRILMENAGANRGALMMKDENDALYIEAISEDSDIRVSIHLPLEASIELPVGLIRYTVHTGQNVVLDNAALDGARFAMEDYVKARGAKSILCAPIRQGKRITGIIYLENSLTPAAFSANRLRIVSILGGQAAISLENSRLYSDLEARVIQRTQELQIAMELARNSQSKIAALNEFAKDVNSAINLDNVIDQIFAYLKENFTIDAIVIGLPDAAGQSIHFYRADMPVDFSEENYRLLRNISISLNEEDSLIIRAVNRRRSISMRRFFSTLPHPVDQLFQSFGAKSLLVLPLIVREDVIGILIFSSFNKEINMRKILPNMESFCEQIAGAINSSNLLRQTKEAKAETDGLNELMKNVNSVSSLVDIMSFIMYYLETEYKFQDFYLLLNEASEEKIAPFSFTSSRHTNEVSEYFMNLKISHRDLSGVFAEILKEKKSIFIKKENITEEDLLARDLVNKGNFDYLLLLPLVIYDELIGILFLYSPLTVMEINEEVRFKLERFLDLIAGSVFNARLLKKVEEAKEEAEQAKEQAEIEKSIAQIAQTETEKERQKSEKLLLNILPLEVANELKEKGAVEPVYFENATIMFTDFKGFTQIAEGLTPQALIKELDGCFSQFDQITGRNNLEKLKTIGDAYMCAGGLPKVNKTHPIDSCLAALEIQAFMNKMKEIKQMMGSPFWELRLGIHSGPLMAGVVGEKKFAYDVWGDTVNTASRMESSGTPGKINISYATYELVKHIFDCEYRGEVDAKNKGKIKMYYLIRLKKEYSKDEEGLVPNKNFFKYLVNAE